MKQSNASAKQQNMFKMGKYTIVLGQCKPKKCKKCKSKKNLPFYIRNVMGTIGTITFCAECDTIVLNCSEAIWKQLPVDVLYGKCQDMVEIALGGAK